MASIDLPRALEDYFAFAETTPTRNGRRFSITLPYVGPDGRLDRLQWWYHLWPAKEAALGESALEMLRTEAIARFQVHIDRWLENTAQVLYGDGAIPQVAAEGNRGSYIYAGISIPVADTPTPADSTPVDSVAADEISDELPDEAGANAQDAPVHQPSGKSAFG
jgi:hypothetical protein